MGRKKDIQLTVVQVDSLLDDDLKQDLDYLLKNGVYCSKCDQICKEGVAVEKVTLNSLNDIVIQGKCMSCNNTVVRTVEFGEDPKFYKLAEEFRYSVEN
ncbi:hypothetical protein [Plebeiibacterium marinum]|uniref:Uncharacterized protein n=1 Tax=Plebeiibacterium marinum TaxID=2992111 RepID=A0AAE3MGA8_9BACT|nr:hypothetical protein [Plebeiobacterium marinum]MCW3807015.1 hypothetical protein [Plebeiobacterium marinum]